VLCDGLVEEALGLQTAPECGVKGGRFGADQEPGAEPRDGLVALTQVPQRDGQAVVSVRGRRVEFEGRPVLFQFLLVSAEPAQRPADLVGDDAGLRLKRVGRLVVAQRVRIGPALPQDVAEPIVDPEIVGVRLPDPLQKLGRVFPLADHQGVQRQQQRHGLLFEPRALDHLVERGPVALDERVAGAIAPAGRVAVRQPRHPEDPVLSARVPGATGPVVECGDERVGNVRCPDALRDRGRVVVHVSEPGFAKRTLVLPVAGPVDRDVAPDADGTAQADLVQSGRQLQVAAPLFEELAQLGRAAVPQPAPRPFQCGRRLGPARRLQVPDHVREILRGGPLRGGRIRFRRALDSGALEEVPTRAADQGAGEYQEARDRRRQGRAPADPPDQPPHRTVGARRDGLAPQEAVQVVLQGRGGGVPEARVLVQALQADGLQVPRHPGVQQRRRHRVPIEQLLHGFHRRRGPKGRPAGQHLVEDRAQRVHVRRRADRAGPTAGLFRGHVAGRPDRRARLSQTGPVVEPAREPEVGDLRRAPSWAVGRPPDGGRALGGQRAAEQNVRRFEVAVHDPAGVRCANGSDEGGERFGRLARRLWGAGQLAGQTSPLNVLHREVRPTVVFPHVMDLYHVGVPQRRHRQRLALEPFLRAPPGVGAGEHHLERDQSVEA
jgi:hypothetical protein